MFMLQVPRHALLRAMLLAALLAGLSAPRASGESSDEIMDAFLADIQSSDRFEAPVKERIQDIVDRLRADEDVYDTVLTEALRAAYPAFSQAVRGLTEIDAAPAMKKLMELTQSEDPYLAADSSFFLARGYVKQEDYESALPLLRRMNTEFKGKTLRKSEALFFQGMAEMNTLDREAASRTLRKFQNLRTRPSRRMREEVGKMLLALEMAEEGSMHDVAEHMDFSRRRLGMEDPSIQTQEVQDTIVAMLDDLIKQAEEQENQQSQSPGQGQSGSGAPGQNAGIGGAAVPDTGVNPLARPDLNAKRSAWDNPRERARQAEALSGLKEKFPARYIRLIEQFSLDLQEEDDDK
jgi:TolA-binding protein